MEMPTPKASGLWPNTLRQWLAGLDDDRVVERATCRAADPDAPAVHKPAAHKPAVRKPAAHKDMSSR